MKEALFFVAGAGVASVITYFCTKNYYAKKADAEIAAVREYYHQKDTEEGSDYPNGKLVGKIIEQNKEKIETVIKDYAGASAPKEEEPKITPGNEPYVIDEEKFDELLENEEYDVMTSYRYFGNGVLVNSRDEVVDMPTIAKFVGLGNLKQLAMQDDDVIYICNDVYKCAYEILREDEDYIDPHIEG